MIEISDLQDGDFIVLQLVKMTPYLNRIGIFRGVREDGLLVLETDNGFTRYVEVDEIERIHREVPVVIRADSSACRLFWEGVLNLESDVATHRSRVADLTIEFGELNGQKGGWRRAMLEAAAKMK